jgi:hypothetical protein
MLMPKFKTIHVVEHIMDDMGWALSTGSFWKNDVSGSSAEYYTFARRGSKAWIRMKIIKSKVYVLKGLGYHTYSRMWDFADPKSLRKVKEWIHSYG